jgi:selenocysteine lyase/cysteine desulfurase
MATATTSPITDYRQEWFEIEDATYLNAASQAPMPKVSHRAVQAALEWKKNPHHMPDSAHFDVPNRIRASIAQLIGATPEEIALTTGASTGMSAVAYGLAWKPGDEILTAKGEFPLQYATWKPMEAREGVVMKVIAPSERFLTAEDFLAAMTPRTRMVSVSLVRFENAVLLDAARIASACHAQGALLLLDVSQACGAIPMNVDRLGADFLVCAGTNIPTKCAPGLFTGLPQRAPKTSARCRSKILSWCAAPAAGTWPKLPTTSISPPGTPHCNLCCS